MELLLPRTMIYDRYCVICKRYFTTANHKQRTHSYGCQVVYLKQKASKANHKRYKAKKKEEAQVYKQACLICGKVFETNKFNRQVLCIGCRLAGKQPIDRDKSKPVIIFDAV